MNTKFIDLVTLGCSKNLVDSERVIKMFERVNYKVIHNPNKINSKIVIINTCGFISDAKEESINTILEYVNAKKRKQISHLYVMGCLSQRYLEDLKIEIPEVDKWYGKFDWESIIPDITKQTPQISKSERAITTPSHYAYVKIAEGCNRFCAFCAIPLITGRYKSRPIEEILDEIRNLVQNGVKEFNIIAQDLSYYGLDLYKKQELPRLIDSIATIPGVEWIRLHYAYPNQFPMELLDVMSKHDNICKYLDIALQHSSNIVLDKMHRNITNEETENLLAIIRKKVPGIHLRTTLMVGFPGESIDEYNHLLAFTKQQRFERMGAFAYCEEDDTYAAKNYNDEISQEEKEARLNQLMSIQENISLELNESKVGKTYKVIIDSEEENYYIGRTEFDSPEVDPEVLIEKTQPLHIGSFYNVKIKAAMPFDLIAEIV